MNIGRLRAPLYATVVLIGSTSVALGGEEPVCDANKPCKEEPVCEGTCCDVDERGQGATIVKVEADPGQALVAQALVTQSAWVQATKGMYVEHFGRVMCLDNCSMLIAYDDGCWYELKENEMLTIVDESPCCAAALLPPPASAAQGLVSAGIAAGAATLAVTDIGASEKATIELPPEEELPPPELISP